MKPFVRKILLTCAGLAAVATCQAWEPSGNRIMTQWGENVDPAKVWQAYPRPLMERDRWQNLNGLWNYAILPKKAPKPVRYEGEILVPFAVESALSGVGRTVGPDSVLWYNRSFDLPAAWSESGDVMLNFGAVDWKADVWVNDVKVGEHTGGYTPFSFNITQALKKGRNTITVKVWDPTDDSFQPRGKQMNRPDEIWYTPVTGIWQTVWLEPVAQNHIETLRITPDIDEMTLTVDAISSTPGVRCDVTVSDNGRRIASGSSINGQPVTIDMPADIQLWTPDSPKLYDLDIVLRDAKGRTVDAVRSYAAMRKFSTARDADGIVRFELNNEPIFHFGTLDQGWWPDGLYTAPSPEALVFDIDQTKQLGFNMIRKHVKVEPAIWYTHCDRTGMIVWQDMPNGDESTEWQNHRYFDGVELKRSAESERNFRKEWQETIDYLYNNPSIAVWVPFNEAWGQFKTDEIAKWTKTYDPTRLVNPASGGNFYTVGDILDLHNYPEPAMYLYDASRANVLGEFGGIGMVSEGHTWETDGNWGYVRFTTPEQVTAQYVEFADTLARLAARGFTGAVYTQTTDVETEINGLMTYDRIVLKVDPVKVRAANQRVINTVKKH